MKLLPLIFGVFSVMGLSLMTMTDQYQHPALRYVRGPSQHGHDYADYNYPKIFEYVRKLLIDEENSKFIDDALKGKFVLEAGAEAQKLPPQVTMTETQLITLVRGNYDFWDDLIRVVKKEIPNLDKKQGRELKNEWAEKIRQLVIERDVFEHLATLDHVEPVTLNGPEGKPGYIQRKLYVDHKRVLRGKELEADNLVDVWLDFIKSIKPGDEALFNFYDFDLMSMAEAIVERSKAGAKIAVGIDLHNYEKREEVQRAIHYLEENGVEVTKVDSVNQNHQKVATIVPANKKEVGRTIFSSGNPTQSGISPKGDLDEIPDHLRPQYSKPNANHTIYLEGDLPAYVTHHELTKTIKNKLRGSEYPYGGVYRFLGPEGKWGTDTPSLLLAFTPRGAENDVNGRLLAQLIKDFPGPYHAATFNLSSPEVEEALLERAKKDIANQGSFKFRSVGEAKNTIVDYSLYMDMIAMKEQLDENGVKHYVHDPDSKWLKELGSDVIEDLRKSVKIAPEMYDDYWFRSTPESKAIYVTVFLHHKFFGNKDFTTLGTSGNISKGAESNQEHYLVWFDREMAEESESIVTSLSDSSKMTVQDEAFRKTQSNLEEFAEEQEKKLASVRRKLNSKAKKLIKKFKKGKSVQNCMDLFQVSMSVP